MKIFYLIYCNDKLLYIVTDSKEAAGHMVRLQKLAGSPMYYKKEYTMKVHTQEV